jgi:hypothetical protein
MVKKKEISTLSAIALVCAFLFPPAGFILGIIALVEINKKSQLKGKGLAIAAIVISIIWPIFLLLLFFGGLYLMAASLGPEQTLEIIELLNNTY